MRRIPVLTPAEADRWDAAAAALGCPRSVLMNNAGRAVVQMILERWSAACKNGVLVACGTGNNGGDGWVVARTLQALGTPVWATEVATPESVLAGEMRQLALAEGVRVVASDGPWPNVGLIVDALLGGGARGAPRPALRPLLERLRDLERPIVAIDAPSGLDLTSGLHHGVFGADTTITFGGPRRGHLLSRDEIGELIVVDIGLGNNTDNLPQLIDTDWMNDRLPPFPAKSHKGTRGTVIIVGGAPEMVGAVRLSARAAFAAGAGLVHVVAPAASMETLRTAEPDVQTYPHDPMGPLDAHFVGLLQSADCVVIGPGLGRAAGRAAFVLEVLSHAKSAVVDADALHALRDVRDAFAAICSERVVIATPHPGEFRALFPECAGELETAPWEAARDASRTSGAIVLLKGVPTVIAQREGQWLTVAAGNPGLASGGSGDVLAGIIGALSANGIPGADAAGVGALSLGVAADHAARRVTVRAMRPMDVITSLPDVWSACARQRGARTSRFPILWQSPAPSAG